MNAFIRNKCEAETLAAFKYIADQLGVDVILESSALTEGGLKEHFKFTLKPENAFLLYAAVSTPLQLLVPLVVQIWLAPPKPDPDLEAKQKTLLELSIETKKLENQKLTHELGKLRAGPVASIPAPASPLDIRPPSPAASSVSGPTAITSSSLSHVVNAADAIAKYTDALNSARSAPRLHMDPKVTTRRSNFYKQLLPYDKVTGVGLLIQDEDKSAGYKDWYVDRTEFVSFILQTDKLPTKTVEATIEIVAPVIAAGDIHWKGLWGNESINFAMKDRAFKEQVMRREISFQHGNSITCLLEIDSKLDETGAEKVSGYSVTTVLSKTDGKSFTETLKGRQHRFNEKHANDQTDLFNEGD